MDRPYRQIEYETRGDVFCARLRNQNIDEQGLEDLAADLTHLIEKEGCRKLVLSLGPKESTSLYSVFLAKLVQVQRCMQQANGKFLLAQVSPEAHRIFTTCGLEKFFAFAADLESALKMMEEN